MPTDFQQAPQVNPPTRCTPRVDADPPPLTWDYALRIRRKAPWDRDLALTTCRNGHTLRMASDVHTIATDGIVSPSYVCVAKGCTFHEYVRLVGWDPNHVFAYVDESEPPT